MTHRIFYVETGDTVELRLIRSGFGFERNKRGWLDQSRPGSILLLEVGTPGVSVADPSLDVFLGVGETRRQMLAEHYK